MIEFEKNTLSQRISENIATQIVEGKLSPGERLLEKDLQELFGTSRSPIREALYLLEIQGVVERVPRKGVFVKKYTKKEVFDFYDIVYTLTDIALQKGIHNRRDQQLEQLNNTIDNLESNLKKQNFKEAFLLVEEIHLALFEISNNSTLIEIYKSLNKRWTTFRYLTLSHPDRLQQSFREYKEIINGLNKSEMEKVSSTLSMKKDRAMKVLDNVFESE